MSDSHIQMWARMINEDESVPSDKTKQPEVIHFALCAKVKDGFFKQDKNIFICQVGTCDEEGNSNFVMEFESQNAQSLSWLNKDKPVSGYNPMRDNDWDYIEGFAKTGKNAEILRNIKNHYGNRFRTFVIMEYRPEDADSEYQDHIDDQIIAGLTPYCGQH